jgi:UDP-N-acetyl-D-glucosamine dehydrogenase
MNEACGPGTASEFAARVAARDLTLGVVGLGYTGLPLAMACAAAGFRTVGYDADAALCRELGAGICHIEDVRPETLAGMITAGRFTAVAVGDLSPVPDVVFICVPTPMQQQQPDLSCVHAATRAVARALRPGMLIISQSTSYPGTTTDVVRPLLEAGGLRAGSDFCLAFSPERTDPGNREWNIHNTPRVVGGLTSECTERAGAVLGAITGDPGLMHPVATPAVAEFAKLLENSYRLVNIGLVNEMAMLAHELGVDIHEVIDAAATKPFGFQAFRPGVGPGGTCIPEDPQYLAWKADALGFHARLIYLAAERNEGMAHYVYVRILEMISRRGQGLGGSRVLCVGASYKPGIADTRHSRALRVMELLEAAGALVDYTDPLVPSIELADRERKSIPLGSAGPGDFDLVAVLVASAGLDLGPFIARGVPVFDAARALAGPASRDVERL